MKGQNFRNSYTERWREKSSEKVKKILHGLKILFNFDQLAIKFNSRIKAILINKIKLLYSVAI